MRLPAFEVDAERRELGDRIRFGLRLEAEPAHPAVHAERALVDPPAVREGTFVQAGDAAAASVDWPPCRRAMARRPTLERPTCLHLHSAPFAHRPPSTSDWPAGPRGQRKGTAERGAAW